MPQSDPFRSAVRAASVRFRMMIIYPDFDSLRGIADLATIAGALLTFVLVIAVLMLVISAIAWATATAHGNYTTASKSRTGILVALGAAILASAGVAWLNWLINLGQQL